METNHVKGYLAGLGTLAVLDAVWLGWLAAPAYKEGIGHLMASEPNWAAAAAFYPLYAAGLWWFAVKRNPDASMPSAAGTGALLGAFAYGTYDLTNLATLDQWPVSLAAMDVAWGSAVSAAVAAVAHRFSYKAPRLAPTAPL